MADGIAAKIGAGAADSSLGLVRAGEAQLFNFQWLARSDARLLSLRFTYGSRCQLFINRLSQLAGNPSARRSRSAVVQEGTDAEQGPQS